MSISVLELQMNLLPRLLDPQTIYSTANCIHLFIMPPVSRHRILRQRLDRTGTSIFNVLIIYPTRSHTTAAYLMMEQAPSLVTVWTFIRRLTFNIILEV